MSTISISKVRALELARFLMVPVSAIPVFKDYAKVQRFRTTLELAIQDFKKESEDYAKQTQEELKQYNEMLQAIDQEVIPEYIEKEVEKKVQLMEMWNNNKTNRKQYIVNMANEAIKPLNDQILKFEKEVGVVMVSVDVNEEDANQSKLYFEKKASEHKWSSPEAYIEIGTVLGLSTN